MKNKSKDWHIGFLIGELIVERYLPSLNGLESQTNISVPVSNEDTEKYKQLEEDWVIAYRKKNNQVEVDKLWIEYREFGISLYQKYLPEVLECHIPIPDNVNMDEVKTGIRVALWDSDRCMYNIHTNENIIIEKDEYSKIFSVIKLNLDIKEHIRDLHNMYKEK